MFTIRLRMICGQVKNLAREETVESLEEIERLFTEGVREAGERTRTAGVETEKTTVEGRKVYAFKGYAEDGKKYMRKISLRVLQKLLNLRGYCNYQHQRKVQW